MRFLPLVAITLVCWCGSPCLALAGQRPSSLPREFSRLQSEHFVAVGDASESQLRAALIELERFRAVLGERIPSLKSTSEAPNVLVLFRNVESMRPIMPRGADGRIRDVGGYFSKAVDANYMVTSADRRQRGFSTIFR